MRIDLGSGNRKFQNCVGIDRIAYADTDLVFDYNHQLPLEDNSVEFVMASHCLEYVDDLQAVMQELYRVCQHKAIVCIVAPYAHVSAHIVNPEYKQLFNEHSPRYWTHSSDTIIDQDEFSLSDRNSWSLLEDEQPLMDFRVLRMEFFYFPSFQTGYDSVELSLLRQSQLNVAYQIMFHLLVVKKPITTEEQLLISQTEILEEPDYVKEQRGPTEVEEELEKEPLFFLDHISSQAKPTAQKPMIQQPVRNSGSISRSSTNSRRSSRRTSARRPKYQRSRAIRRR